MAVGERLQRIHKVLEDANLKIDAELSDMLGKSGRAILDALVAGETDPVRLAALAHRNVKSPQAKLAEALRGRVTPHHRFLLQLHLQQIDGLDASLGALDREIEANLAPFRLAVDIATTHPGINQLSAEAIISEIGAGSRPLSSNAPTPPKTNAEAIMKPNTCACAAGADRKKPSAPSPPPFSPPSTTCSGTERFIRTSAQTTSVGAPKIGKPIHSK